MMEFEDLTWYWIAGYAGDLFTLVVILMMVLTLIGLFTGDKHD